MGGGMKMGGGMMNVLKRWFFKKMVEKGKKKVPFFKKGAKDLGKADRMLKKVLDPPQLKKCCC